MNRNSGRVSPAQLRATTLGLVIALASWSASAHAQEVDAGPPQLDAGAPSAADAGKPMSAEDQKMLQEIEAAQAQPAPGAPQQAAFAAAPSAGAAPPVERGGPGSFFSNAFNPAISFNGLFLGSFSSEKSPPPGATNTGLQIQEMEVQFLSNVDPYLSANVVLALPNGEGIGVEEGNLTLTPQPLGLSLRAGKLLVPIGRENIHTHALPFIQKSLVGQAVFGDELGEVGVEASYLMPVPWYTLLTLEVLNGDNEVAFNSPNGRDLLGFAGLKNVFDLTDNTTLELGLAYLAGKNFDQKLTQVANAHLVIKWKPAEASTTSSAVFTVEGTYAHVPLAGAQTWTNPAVTEISGLRAEDTSGFYAYFQWQLAKRWFGGVRYDYLRPAIVNAPDEMRESAILVLAPTEFSAVRLQGDVLQPGGGAPQIFEGFLQLNFTLGAHPAHSY